METTSTTTLIDIVTRTTVIDVQIGDSKIVEVQAGNTTASIDVQIGGSKTIEVQSGGTTTIVNNSGSNFETRIAATDIGGHRIVAIDPNGKASIASSDDTWCRHTVKGISAGASVSGGNIEIIVRGEIVEPSWSWIFGKPVFLGSNGLPTQTAPETGFIVQLGIAYSPTSIFVFILNSIILEN